METNAGVSRLRSRIRWLIILIAVVIWLSIWVQVNSWYEDGVRENISGRVTEKYYTTQSNYRHKLEINNTTWIAVNGITYYKYNVGDNISGSHPILFTDFQRMAAGIWWITTWVGFLSVLAFGLIISKFVVGAETCEGETDEIII